MLIRPLDALIPRAAHGFGEKTRNLAALVRGGFPVPAGFALAAETIERALSETLPPALRPAALLAQASVSEAQLLEARQRVLEGDLGAELSDGLLRAFDALGGRVQGVALRSSSLAEDVATASAAGLHLTVLNVRNPESLLQATRECLARMFSPAIRAYLDVLGGGAGGGMGLLVQAMVPADASGVVFTQNPLSGDPDELVIDACFGLGTGVTDGTIRPDTYRIDRRTRWVRDRVLGEQATRAVCGLAGGVEDEALPASLSGKQVLDEHVLEQLIALGRRIQEHFRSARDIEFAVVGDTVFILQARPVTLGFTRAAAGRRRRQGQPDPRRLVWSNLNVGEALPGVATPLTWSVLSAFSELGFRQAFAALGCKVPKDATLVGSFRGRIYLNLSGLAEVASQVPGLRPAAVLPLGGAEAPPELDVPRTRGGQGGFLLRLPATAARFARSNIGFAKRVERFERRFEAEHMRISGMDLRILSAAALDETLADVQQLLDEAGAMMLTAYGGLLASIVPLRTALAILARAETDRVQQLLLSAIEDVESAHPGREMLRVARCFERDAAARAALLEGSADSVGARCAAGRFGR